MSDSASDTSEITVASAEAGDSVERPRPLVPSPTLVPALGPAARDDARDQARDDFVRRLQQVVAGPNANSKYGALRTRKPPAKPKDAPEPAQEEQEGEPQDQPSAPDADAEIGEHAQDERAQDEQAEIALKLLQELAQKSSGNEQTLAPAAEPDATLASYLAAVDTAGDLKLPAHLAPPLAPSLALANAEPPPAAHSSAGRWGARFAIAACCAVLAAGMTGVFLWSQIVPAPDAEPPARMDVTASAPSAPSSVPVQAEIPSPRSALAGCDLPASKDPYAGYFLVGAHPLGGTVRKTAEPTEKDFGWYSLMAMKARLEQRGGHC